MSNEYWALRVSITSDLHNIRYHNLKWILFGLSRFYSLWTEKLFLIDKNEECIHLITVTQGYNHYHDLLTSILCSWIFLHWIVAFAQAMLSITNVTVTKLTKHRTIRAIVLNNHPASAKAAGKVRAPVPTIKLNT